MTLCQDVPGVVSSAKEIAGGTAGLLAIVLLLLIMTFCFWVARRVVPLLANLLITREKESQEVRQLMPKFAKAAEDFSENLPRTLNEIRTDVKDVKRDVRMIVKGRPPT